MAPGSLTSSPHALVQAPSPLNDPCDQENTAEVTVCDFQGQVTTGVAASGSAFEPPALGEARRHAVRTLKPPRGGAQWRGATGRPHAAAVGARPLEADTPAPASTHVYCSLRRDPNPEPPTKLLPNSWPIETIRGINDYCCFTPLPSEVTC